MALGLGFSLTAQTIVTSQFAGTFTKEEIGAVYPFFTFITDVNAYSVTYKSVDVDGMPDTLSGYIALPKDTTWVYPRLAYMHGTVDNRWAVPSQGSNEADLAIAYAGMGTIAVAPDYPGLGTGRGFHPYVHVESQSRSGVDLLKASLELADENGLHYHDGVLLTGYSQGGHGSLGLHKEIEEKYPELNVSASASMSGPYSLSGTMLDFVLDGNPYTTPAYLPNVVQSMQTAYGNIYTDLNEIFKAPYITEIERFYNEEIGLFDLNGFLLSKLTELEGDIIAVKLFQDELITELMTNDDHPFLVALRENDLIDWAPAAPVRMYYCLGDEQVNYMNAIVAEAGMTAAGGADVEALEAGGLNFNHGGCVLPATLASSNFLLQYQNLSVYTDVENIELDQSIRSFPNPTADAITIFHDQTDLTDAHYNLTSISGKTKIGQVALTNNQIDLSNLSNGLYLLTIYDQDGILVHRSKVVKQ